MIKRILITICGFLFLTLTMTECVYEEVPEEMIIIQDSVSFSLDIIPIFNADCNFQGCHNQGGINPDLSPGNAWTSLQTGYIDLATPAASTLITKMDGGSMSQYSTQQDIATITQWITEGAKNN